MLEFSRTQKRISLSIRTPLVISCILPKILPTWDLYVQLLRDVSTWRSERHLNLKPVQNWALLSLPDLLLTQYSQTRWIAVPFLLLFRPKVLFLSPQSVPHISSASSICRESVYITPPHCHHLSKPPPSLTWMCARVSHEVSLLHLCPLCVHS